MFIRLLVLGFLGCMGVSFGQTVVSPGTAKEVFAILEQLPPQWALEKYNGMVRFPETALNKEQLEIARTKVKLAAELVPKLRTLLKEGASVFDYPSLLAHGSITYTGIHRKGNDHPKNTEDPFSSTASVTPTEYGYRLYIGLAAGEFPHPWDFAVFFDSKGLIISIASVDWKK